jgi:hypothetical protein
MNSERIALVAAAIFVAAGVVGGFTLLGSPQHQRQLALDQRRVSDLQIVAADLTRYARPANGLPSQLPRDFHVVGYDGVPATVDPVTRKPYEYARESSTRYRLCAIFAEASRDDDPQTAAAWRHKAGRQCFRFDVTRIAVPLSSVRVERREKSRNA